MIKTAEPPPPEGVSAASWDKHLQKGKKLSIDHLIAGLIKRKPHLAGKFKRAARVMSAEETEAVNRKIHPNGWTWEDPQKDLIKPEFRHLLRPSKTFGKTKQADGYRPSALLSVVGKLKRDEGTSTPANVALGAGKVWGNLVSIAGDINAQPTRVGYGTLLSHIPDVINAQRTRGRAEDSLSFLKHLSPAEKKTVADNLRKNLAGVVAGSLVDSGVDTALAAARQSGVRLPPFTGLAAGKTLGYLVNRGVSSTSKEEPLLSQQQAEKFLKQMGVTVPLYAGKENAKAGHYPGSKSDVLRGFREKRVENRLAESNKGLGSQILREGGIIVPLEKTKTSAAMWSKMATNFN